jgi:hypothetical protein
MTEISDDEGISRARSRLNLEPQIPARAWRVQRPDRPGKAYYIIVFGDAPKAVAVAAVDAGSGEVLTSAALPGTGPHLTVDADKAVQKAALKKGARAELVWKPCRFSLSPLYPFWQVSSETQTVYVDQQGVVWQALEPAGPGG